ncbi:hypothetical protein BWX42_06455 [Dolosigranulum pigrum]|uniref:Oxidoreductase n=1 Tax=Dolosigranulum pigrum TaxID=29394 RepID=A0A1S8KPF2_9LACT|nr:hypothetical protein BWX42_06455 [Dolosigranulum pigrum]
MMQLRLGIVGLGFRSPFVKHWHQPDGDSIITAVADLNQEAIDTFKETIAADVYATNDFQELLERDDVDAVVILTEDYKHKDHALKVLEAGKHLYLDKPMAISTEDCDEIYRAWQASGQKMMIGFNMRYMPMYQTMKRYIDEGFIGEVKAIWVRHFVGFGGQFYYQDWHRNQKGTYSLLLQKASHDIDVIHMLTGSYVQKVAAFGGLDFYQDEANFEADNLEHQTDWPIDVEDNNVVIIGTKGRMENDELNGTITIKTRQTDTLADKSDITIQMKPTEGSHAGADPKITQAFVDYILRDIEPDPTPWDGRMSVAVGVEATKSLRSGGGVRHVSQEKP